MDNKISVLKNTNFIFDEMVEDELLQLNGGKDIIKGWLAEKLLDKVAELVGEIVKIVSKPDDPPKRSHSSGGRSIPKYGTPVDVGIDWRI